ncbi:DgyrCDS6694 [Dimorphilus gyrociliatus]|uniref:DgyrCDS6694 n=1 Tax=Dimorphilus gyrociliatus TaxID=2664684 RepID=A0A7I8VRI0_9ANNE|nr:DgyrCDS6694 [Dimorphilus gyrociliatus]
MSQSVLREDHYQQLPTFNIEPSSIEHSPELMRKDMVDETSSLPHNRALTPAEEATEDAKIVLKCVLMKRCFSSNDVEALPGIKETDGKQQSSNDALSSSSSNDDNDRIQRKKKSLKKRVLERLRQTFKRNSREKLPIERRQTAPVQKAQIQDKDRKIFNHFLNALKPKKSESNNQTKKRSRSDETMFRIDATSSAEQQQILANYTPTGKVHSLDKNHRFEVKRDFAQFAHSQPPVKTMGLKDLQKHRPMSNDEADGVGVDCTDAMNFTQDQTDLSPCGFVKKGSFHDLPRDKQEKLYAKIAEKVLEIGDDIQKKHFERKRSLSTSNYSNVNVTDPKRRSSIPDAPTNMYRRFRSPSLELTVNNIVRSGSYGTFQSEMNRVIVNEEPINQVAVLFNITSEAINAQPTLFSRIKENCIRFFQDKLSGMIASQGGWESVVEDSSGEVD